MTYLKSPTEDEKNKYWKKIKSTIFSTIYINSGLIIILFLAYLFYDHKEIITKYGLYTLLTIIVSLSFSTLYSRVYKYWHLIHKRHRIGYYSSFMNSLMLSLLITIVSIIGVTYTFNNMIPHGLKTSMLLSIPFTIILTAHFVIKFRKEKPGLPRVTLQENEDREFLKELYYYVLNDKGFRHIYNSSYFEEINYLGTLDCYMNYGVYNHAHIEKWKNDLTSESLTVDEIFKEMSILNDMVTHKIYNNIYKKAEIKTQRLKKLINEGVIGVSQLEIHIQEYLD